MKKFRIHHQLLIVLLFLTACSSDDSSSASSEQEQNLPPTITSYTASVLFEPDDPEIAVRELVSTGIFEENKLTALSEQLFIEGEPQEARISRKLTYTNGLVTLFERRDQDILEMIYDELGNMTAINWSIQGSERFFRFVHLSDTEVYFEVISLPHDDPQTEVGQRIILRFDASDNVIAAGKDLDLDGIMDAENQFSYTNNSLTQITLASGETFNYEYTEILDSFVYMYDQAIGKKINRILCAELYAGASADGIFACQNSEFISTIALTENDYETGSNNFFTKRTNVSAMQNNTGTQTEVVEFTFE
ncbi:hypothetical protein POV27_05500 [Aureisphaera galaxeae]|uniref:hypothetical protein n=1 Tax=Aureisphaera galaxeae TaxID=1538023 RepID=UPI00234FD102|nr:hypothetical protein [Aureisphaera galaxeae]MDC8003496.1 hypothetical protein [Aureisphaera galaxeae]